MWMFQRPEAFAVLNDKLVKKSLARYFAVMQNQSPAKFLIAKKTLAEFRRSASTEQLWREHAALIAEFNEIQREIDEGRRDFQAMLTPEKSFLDLKIEIANRILSSCHLCVRNCSANRLQGKSGYVVAVWKWACQVFLDTWARSPSSCPREQFSPWAARCGASTAKTGPYLNGWNVAKCMTLEIWLARFNGCVLAAAEM